MKTRPRPSGTSVSLVLAVLTLLAAGLTPRTVVLAATGAAPSAPSSPPPSGSGAPAVTDADLLQAYLPKDDLGVTRFLQEHPAADGRGVIVAILDTGIDLHHPGLLRTPDGKRKILDVFDATDNGLVELPEEVTTADSVLWGHTGRLLRLGAHRSEDGRYRLGRISARETLPPGLLRRLMAERAEARRLRIDAWEARTSAEEVRETGDSLRAYRELRRAAHRDWDDPGPAYDLVALRLGGAWKLVIDTDEDGELGDETPLAPFREEGDLALFPGSANFSLALSWIADDGARASLVFDEGGHGTHVAGIVGAWYGPDDPLNGLAPGVQFLAVRIGNGRFGGSTSHNSIPKGITWAIEHGAMVANISFGGTSHFNDGRELQAGYLDEVVQNHGIFITASAGNEGPGLSTVGAPATARRIFTIGAALSPLKMMTSYGGLPRRMDARRLAGTPMAVATPGRASAGSPPSAIRMFDFSSRGPLANGSPGVDFISPGAAVSTLPTWHLTRQDNWHGTSMAAPQACGSLALLLSAAMQDGVPVSPPRVDRALRATARPIPDVPFVEQGAGLLSLPEAYDALKELARVFRPDTGETNAGLDSAAVPIVGVPATRDPVCFWRLAVENAGGAGEGLYQRDERSTVPYWVTWWIAPDLPEKAGHPLRAAFHRIVRLRSNVPWLEAPPQLSIPASGVTVRVLVDPSRLAPGLNCGRIALETVALTLPGGRTLASGDAPGEETALTAVVIRPEEVAPPAWRLERTLELTPGARRAIFVRVPDGATRLTARLRETQAEPANSYDLALTALSHLHPPPALRGGTGMTLARGADEVVRHRVEGGTVVEIALFASWVNAGDGTLELTLDFDGVEGPALLGADASLRGEQSREARWGEAPLLVPPGRDGVILPLRSRLRDLTVRVSASLDGKAEPLRVEWHLLPDTLHPAILEGRRDPLLLRGDAWVRLDREETILCDPRAEAALEDFLDDAFYRLYTPTGRIVDRGTLSSGPFRLEAPKDGPPTGWYRLEFSIYAAGRDLVRDPRFLAPEIIRRGSYGRVAAFSDPVLARLEGDSSSALSLPRGSARPTFLRVRGLPENGLFTGTVEVGDLLGVPLRADTQDPDPAADTLLSDAIDAMTEEARRLRSQPPGAPAADVRDAIASLRRADALERVRENGDLDQARDDAQVGSDDSWNRLMLRVDLALRHDLPDDAERWLDEADAVAPDKPQNSSERRRAAEQALRKAALALVRGNDKAARKALDRAVTLGIEDPMKDAVEAELLRREGDPIGALAPLHRARRNDPWNARLARTEIDLYLELGWPDLAGERIAAWREAYPRDWGGLVTAARRLESVETTTSSE